MFLQAGDSSKARYRHGKSLVFHYDIRLYLTILVIIKTSFCTDKN